MKILNDGCFMLNKTKDGWYFSQQQGYVMEKDEVMLLCKELKRYAEKHKDDLVAVNNINDRYYDDLFNKRIPYRTIEKKKSYGYVYLFKCGEKYKIGISKDIKRRLKDLDTRPYKVELVTNSKLILDPIRLEKKLHESLSGYKINGEWFNLPEDVVSIVRAIIENAEVEYGE